jgi:predicted transcriptional regulator
MASTTVRVTPHTHEVLRELAAARGESLQQVLEDAVEQYRRERFFADLHAAYARLRADQAAWEAELAERAELEGTLADGLGGEA